MASPPTPVNYVLDKEVEAIHARRRVAGFDGEHADKLQSLAQTKKSLVGLALSGGGVRSGAFCLGFIQALYTAGRMRSIDFISSVSGGGYAGALFSAEVARSKNVNWDRRRSPSLNQSASAPSVVASDTEGLDSLTHRLDIETNVDGSQPQRIKELALYGRMMGDVVRLLSRHFGGFLITFAFLVSGVVACAALLAIVMRLPYTYAVLPYLHELKFSTDMTVPLFPAFLAFVFWVACVAAGRIARMLGHPIPTLVKYSYVLLMSTIVLGVLAFLALGDVDINTWVRKFEMPTELQSSITYAISWIGTLLSGVFLTLLLPILAPRKLLESGADSKNPYKRMIFNISGWALVIGVPLFLYFFLVKENISGHTLKRPNADRLTESHIENVDRWLLRLKAQEKIGTNEKIVGKLLAALEGRIEQPGEELRPVPTALVAPARELDPVPYHVDNHRQVITRMTENEDEANFLWAWVQALTAPITGETSPYLERVDDVKTFNRFQQELAAVLTDNCLSDPWLLAAQLPTTDTNDGATAAANNSGNAGVNTDGQMNPPEVGHETALRRLRIDKDSKEYKQVLAAYALLVDARTYVEQSFTRETAGENGTDVAENGKRVLARWVKEPDNRNMTWQALCEYHDQRNTDKQKAVDTKKEEIFAGNLKNLVSQIRTNNWVLLHALYPEYIRPQNTTFAFVVNETDQKTRAHIALWAIGVFALTGLMTNLNRTNLHGVYRDQLAATWLPDKATPLSTLDTCAKGAPMQLMQGTLNRMGTRQDPDAERQSRFCMSYLFCGSKKVGYRPTSSYLRNKLTVADAMAISGAAVSPISSRGMLARVMLFVTNFRLGQWLLNPAELEHHEYWPSPLLTMANWLRYPEQRTFLFVSDGGHLENTGMAALLERRCRLMILADASYDKGYEFIDMVKLLQDARAKYGIRVRNIKAGHIGPVDEKASKAEPSASHFAALRPNDEGISRSYFLLIEIQYPDSPDGSSDSPLTGLIILCKSSLTGDEVPELVELAHGNDTFPHDLTTDQFLDTDRFEAYVELGRHIGECVDRYVCDGHLDKYDLPLDWRSESLPTSQKAATTIAKQAKMERSATAHDSTSIASREFWKRHSFFLNLEDLPFDSTQISQSLEQFEQVLKEYRDQKTNPTLDSAEFEYAVCALSNWARGRGENADKKLRKQFCQGLDDIVQRHIDTIRSDSATHLSCLQMLELLGKQVSGISTSLQLLSTAVDASIGSSDDQASGS